MWFFDSVLEETPIKTGGSSQSDGGAAATAAQKKKDDQDGSFLIIDESMKASDIPDTAVKLFDSSEEEVIMESPSSEVSFFSDPVLEESNVIDPLIEASGADVISFMDETDVSQSWDAILDQEPISATAPDSISFSHDSNESMHQEVIAQGYEVGSIQSDIIDTIPEDVDTEEAFLAPEVQAEKLFDKSDIYAPVKKAIAEYDQFLAALLVDAAKKDAEIAEYNEKIAEAKEIAKRTIDAAKESSKIAIEQMKRLDAEKNRIEQMRAVFTAQLQ